MLPSPMLLALFGALAATVTAAPSKNGVEFLFPTDGLTLNYLDTINVTYTSPFPKPLLYTFCTNKTNTKKLIQKELIEATPFNASHLITLNYRDVAACYWNLRPNTSAGYGARSFAVKLLTDGRSSTTLGLPSGTTLPPSTSVPAETEPTDVVGGDEDGNGGGGGGGGMSTGAKAGIGAGVAVVAIIAIAGLVFFLLRRRKNRPVVIADEIHKTPGSEGSTLGGGYTDHPNGNGAEAHEVGGHYNTEQAQKEQSTGDAGALRWGGPKVGELPVEDRGGNGQIYEMSGDTRAVEAPEEGLKR